ncbi:MAG TPA: class I SAM-dependent methyltransferase [Candidatus Acidoferrum sp.]|nr:class I SAM-dependent methyltransferase [Candidatus Acidoferrum sp.]
MDEKQWWDFWNTTHRAVDNNDDISSELFSHVSSIIRDFSRGQAKRILEVACGTGTLSRQLKFSSYHGLDLSSAAIAIARSKAAALECSSDASRPVYEVADIHHWLPPAQSFDVAVCVDAVAYFCEQKSAVQMMAQAMAPSGRMLLTTINPFVYNRIRRTSRSPLKEGSVSRWLSRAKLHSLVSSVGLIVERSYTIMPRGNMGILRLLNARSLNLAFGSAAADALRRYKEQIGLGQYRVILARKG